MSLCSRFTIFMNVRIMKPTWSQSVWKRESGLCKRPRGQGVKKYLDERGMRILDALDRVAKQHKSTPTRVALAWLIARPSITAPIASATKLEQLNDLIEGANLILDAESMEILNQASEYQIAANSKS